MKRIQILAICIIAVSGIRAQQKPHYTQYMMNQYIVNPALSGIENYIDVKLSHRDQWVGLQDAPVTSYFTIQGPVGKTNSRTSITGIAPAGENPRGREYWTEYTTPEPHHGAGLQIIHDAAGAFTHSSVYGTYAYHLGLSSRTSVAAGFGAGVSRIALNQSKLRFGQANDPSVFQNTISNKWKPDVNAGLYLYSADYFVGISAQQLIPQTVEFTNNVARKEDGKLVPHIFLTAGYRLLLGEDFNLMPSIMVKYISPLPMQVDISAKLQYRDIVWAGLSLRTNDGLAAMTGVNISSKFNIGYSYDYSTTALNNYSRGSHEIMLGFLLRNNYGDTCPRNVW